MSKKADYEKTIMKIVELAESVGWKTLAIAQNGTEFDVTGLLVGDDDFINGFKEELENSAIDEIKEAFTEEIITEVSDSEDPEDPDDTTYH